jgi:starch-binding outer membrane protein, SusD/RagB family
MRNNFLKQMGLLLLAISFFYSQSGCKKFLDRQPLGIATAGDVTQGGAEDQVFGLYSGLTRWGMSQLPFITSHGSRADDALISTPGDGDASYIDQFQYTKDYWLMDGVWDDHLGFISQASGVIFDIDSIDKVTPSPLNVVNKAEARFLRAYAYFDMVRDYGGVPKIDFKVYDVQQANKPRASAAEIYALIEADLLNAAQNLPVSWPSKYAGRATKGAANAFLAKMYLYRQNWAAALSSAEAVINSSQYGLLPNFADVFTEKQENGVESIFEIVNYENEDGSVGSYGSAGNWSAGYQGVRGSGQWDLGWGWNIPSQGLVDTAFEAGDPRKGQTILFSGKPDDYLINDGKFGATLPPSIWPHFNKKVYTDPARRAATGDKSGSWLDMLIMRYSDVLLIAAEAANELGGAANVTKALNYLEQVRARARKGTPALPAITSTDKRIIRKAIKKERRSEFALEFERFYDLVRWTPAGNAGNDSIDAPHVLGPQGYTLKNALLPIPQSAIDKSQNVLTQNPGY